MDLPREIVYLIVGRLTPQDLISIGSASKRLRADCVAYITNIRRPIEYGYSCMNIESPLGALNMLRCHCGMIGWDIRKNCECWKICTVCERRIPKSLMRYNVCMFNCLPKCFICNLDVFLALQQGKGTDYFEVVKYYVQEGNPRVILCRNRECANYRFIWPNRKIGLTKHKMISFAMRRWNSTTRNGKWCGRTCSKQYAMKTWLDHIRPMILARDPDNWISRLDEF